MAAFLLNSLYCRKVLQAKYNTARTSSKWLDFLKDRYINLETASGLAGCPQCSANRRIFKIEHSQLFHHRTLNKMANNFYRYSNWYNYNNSSFRSKHISINAIGNAWKIQSPCRLICGQHIKHFSTSADGEDGKEDTDVTLNTIDDMTNASEVKDLTDQIDTTSSLDSPELDHSAKEDVLNEPEERSPKSKKIIPVKTKTSSVLNDKNMTVDQVKPTNATEIKGFLQKSGISFSEGYTCFITTCPRYTRRRIKMAEINKMFINMTTGYFVCLSCKKTGSWSSFMDNTDNLLSVTKHGRLPECLKHSAVEDSSKDLLRIHDTWEKSLEPSSLSEEELSVVLHIVGAKGITKTTLEKYHVRITPDKAGLVLPHFGLDGNLIGIKIIAEEEYKVKDIERSRVITRTIPRVNFHGLFGLNVVQPSHQEAVLTISEFDAMAVQQTTGMPALALPKKDSILPQEMLPMLERFKKVILWFGGDMKVWENTKQFARKLNEKRCYLVRPDELQPAPLKALNQGLKLSAVLKDTKPVKHKSIIAFTDLRKDVLAELTEAEQVAGTKWKRYPQLNKLLKGHRRGELSIFTGPTGSGKTTFISDYSLDLCMQGINTLWGSFEINNVRLMKKMLIQYSQTNLVKHVDKFEEWADKFEQLPMYFMKFHGQENIQRVVETMSHAVYVHDIAHVIVDNLQFMMGVEDVSSGTKMASERFYKQDQIISAFRKFATNMNCHVSLVIHPRKERETDELSVSSIFGSAKASQESDNILIIQDRRAVSLKGRKYLQIAKNRFDGELGIMLLKFDKETLSYQIKPKEKSKTKSPDGKGDLDTSDVPAKVENTKNTSKTQSIYSPDDR